MAKIEHKPSAGKCSIHTARSKTKCPNAKKTCHWEDNCDPLPNIPKGHNEAHHILPIACVNGYSDQSNKAAIKACYNATKWCIHQKHNMLALPIKYTYFRRSNESREPGPPPKHEKGHYPDSKGLNLPAHNLGHHAYNREVKKRLVADIWKSIKKSKSKKKHPSSAKLKAVFTSLEKHFKKQLEKRGSRKHRGGTSLAITKWENFKASGGKMPTYKSKPFWIVFSMADDGDIDMNKVIRPWN